VSVTVE